MSMEKKRKLISKQNFFEEQYKIKLIHTYVLLIGSRGIVSKFVSDVWKKFRQDCAI